jgi:4-carboxymuconolactone decarboxylase
MEITRQALRDSLGEKKGELLWHLFSRQGMALRQRHFCAISCLQGIGKFESLTSYLKFAISDHGMVAPFYEVLLQGYLFSGYPRAIESFFCLSEALGGKGLSLTGIAARKLDSDELLIARGDQTARAIHRDKFDKIHNKISELSPDLGYLMIAEGYGHVMSRPALGFQERELAVVSTLTAIGAYRQLNSHIRGSLNVGCSAQSVFEAILMDSPWVDLNAIQGAADIWAGITGERAVEIEKEYPNLSV